MTHSPQPLTPSAEDAPENVDVSDREPPIEARDDAAALDPEATPTNPVGAAELAAFLAGRMCHDYISPAGAIVSGLDLLEDPSAQDMRDEAMEMIAASARKLVAALSFDRVAFGSSAAAENFDVRQLETLTRDVFAHVRADLEWIVAPTSLPKPAARALLNLAQIGAGALPMGGLAKLSVIETEGEAIVISLQAIGARVRMRPEVLAGLDGKPLDGGLGGHWVQAYYLRQIVDAASGSFAISVDEGEAVVTVKLPI